MGIRFTCPSGHKLHVKTFLAGKRGVCPHCGAKFVIPTQQDSEQTPARSLLDSLQQRSGESFTSTRIAATPDTASASMIIAVTDERLAADSDSSDIRLAESFGSPLTPAPPILPPPDPKVLPPPPTISTAIGAVESPAAWHVSRRQRHQRQQLNAAIVLLAAVILLALILIWVLQRGASGSSAGETKLNQFSNAWSSVTIRGDCLS